MLRFASMSEIRANIDYVVSNSDAIFLDIRLKDGNGIEGAKEIILKYPHLKLGGKGSSYWKLGAVGKGNGFPAADSFYVTKIYGVAFMYLRKIIRTEHVRHFPVKGDILFT